MRARWTSDPCYAFFGVDGTECSFLIYLSEVEWFCPRLPWRNQTAARTAPKSLPRVQVGLDWLSSGTVGGNLTPRPQPHGMGLPALLVEDPQITFCGIQYRELAWEAS